ncbi:MAG: DUF1840 domain-containing protein [Orrella sp.]
MIVTFTCNVDADVIMMGDQAQPILGTAGKDVSAGLPERGVFTEEQLADAIARLEAAIKAEPPREHTDDDEEDDQREKPKTEVVLLAQRVYPLLSMMKKAQSANTSVMWETSSGW